MTKLSQASDSKRVPAKPAAAVRSRPRKYLPVLPSALKPTKVSEREIELAVRSVTQS